MKTMVMLAITLMLIVSCAKPELPAPRADLPSAVDEDIIRTVKERLPGGDDPSAFAAVMPDSTIIRGAVTVFRSEPPRIAIATNADGFSVDGGIIAIESGSQLETNVKTCPAILLDNATQTIALSGSNAATAGNFLHFIDLAGCAEVFRLPRPHDFIAYDHPFLLNYEDREFILMTVGGERPVFSGGLRTDILSAGLTEQAIYLFTVDGELAVLDIEARRFFDPVDPVISVERIVVNGDRVGMLTTDDRFALLHAPLTDDAVNGRVLAPVLETWPVPKDTACVITNDAEHALCGGVLVGKHTARRLPERVDAAHVADEVVFVLRHSTVFAYGLEQKKRKSLMMSADAPSACVSDGAVFVRDIDGTRQRYEPDGTGAPVDAVPAACRPLDVVRGMVNAGGWGIRLADVVNEDERHTMLRRSVGEDVYFYFKKK